MPIAIKILTTTVFFSPLLLAESCRTSLFAFDTFCLLAGILTLCSKNQVFSEHKRFTLIPLFLLVTYLLVQITPLPPLWLKTISPETWSAYQKTIWVVAADTWMPISIQPHATLTGFIHLAAIGALCITLINSITSRQDIISAIKILSKIITLWAILAITFTLILAHTNFVPEKFQSLLSELRNSLLVFGATLLPLLWCVYSINKPHVDKLTTSMKLHIYLHSLNSFPHLSYALSTILICLTVFIIPFPATAIALVAGGGIYRAMLLFMKYEWTTIRKVLASMVVATGVLLPMATNRSLSSLQWLWGGGSALFPDVMSSWGTTWFGSGIGSHEDIFSTTDTYLANSGVNIALEAIVELWLGLGLVGTFLLALSLYMLYTHRCDRDSRVQVNRFRRHIIAGCVASTSTLTVCIGGCFPGGWTALIFLVFLVAAIAFCGDCKAAVNARGMGHADSFSNSRWAPSLLAICFLGVMLISFIHHGLPIVMTQINSYSKETHLELSAYFVGKNIFSKAGAIVELFPFNNEVQSQLGRTRFSQKLNNEAYKYFFNAFKYSPLKATSLFDLAGTLAFSGDTLLVKQLLSLKVMQSYHPDVFSEQVVLRLLDEKPADIVKDIIKFVLRQAPHKTSRFVALMNVSGWDNSQIHEVMATNSISWFQYGNYLNSAGDHKDAENAFDKAINICVTGLCDDVSIVLKIINYYVDVGQSEKALQIAVQSVRIFPSNEKLRFITSQLSVPDT